MGWRALYKDGTEKAEGGEYGRPVADGEEGKLLVIAQEDYGHTVAIDLNRGIIAIDYTQLNFQNGTVEIHDPRVFLWVCDETNIVGDLAHIETTFPYARDDDGKKIIEDGRFVKVRNDKIVPLTFRPIWFTRMTDGVPTKVIGTQTTLPKEQGGGNYKKMVSLFIDGRIGIS